MFSIVPVLNRDSLNSIDSPEPFAFGRGRLAGEPFLKSLPYFTNA